MEDKRTAEREDAMPKFIVYVEKQGTDSGSIVVEARSAKAAIAKVETMIGEGLETVDDRIAWDGYAYQDFTFQTTGDVD